MAIDSLFMFILLLGTFAENDVSRQGENENPGPHETDHSQILGRSEQTRRMV